MSCQPWTREQDLAVLYLKIAYGDELRRFQNFPAVFALAKGMNRSIESIYMRKANFDSLDPAVPWKGLSNAAKLTKLTEKIWNEYEHDPDRVLCEARRAYQGLAGASL